MKLPFVLTRLLQTLVPLLAISSLLCCGPTSGQVGFLDVPSDAAVPETTQDTAPDSLSDIAGPDTWDVAALDFTDDASCSLASLCPQIPCQTPQCTQGRCLYEPADDDSFCDDGDPCTLGDSCLNGICKGLPLSCPPSDACNLSACDPAQGICTSTPVEGACDDKNLCTTGDTCSQGGCGGSPVDCDDANPCSSDSCDVSQGCIHLPLTGLPCLTPNPCVAESACSDQALCLPTKLKSCDDGNDCTQDSCNTDSGDCRHLPLADIPCNDANACTQNDSCVEGTCFGSGIICDDDNTCTNDICSPASGCLYLPNALACDDSNPCTDNDLCSGGTCLPGAPKNCSDGNPCTLDTCDPLTGLCIHQQTDWPCNDSNLCTTQDRCVNGACVGIAVDCRDTNPCTSDSCEATVGCLHTPISAPCEDGNLCTLGDLCAGGACKSGPTAPDCDDANPCTADVCSPASGLCLHTPVAGPCDDANPCTLGDSCFAGTCQPGTTDWCECSSDLDCAPLDDDNLCNGILHCDTTLWPFRCRIVPDSIVICDSQFDTQCSRQKCQPDTGHCLFVDQPNGYSCDDQDACTSNDACQAGQCLPSSMVSCADPNPCVVTWCDPLFGCQYQPNNVPCSDGNACTLADRCSIGLCIGSSINCSDANPCTADYCNPDTGTCSFSPSPGTCNDGNPCTVQDLCSDGICTGVPRDCNDGKPCTADSCDPLSGCLYQNLQGPCSDGNACTTGDACIGADCVGSAIVCNDFNPCTDDVCSPTSGCLYIPNINPCDDASLCTTQDTCRNGSCIGNLVSCNDDNPCTADSCSHQSGCHNQPLHQAWCSDGNLCTQGDICNQSTCVPGSPPDCDDLDNCTVDGCEPGLGCTHTPSGDPVCLSCGPLFPIDGTTLPAPTQLSVALLSLCDSQSDTVADPEPALILSASLQPDCSPNVLEMIATTLLPPWSSPSPMTVALGFRLQASACPYAEEAIAAVGMRFQQQELIIWQPELQIEEQACGQLAEILPSDQEALLTLTVDYANLLVHVRRDAVEQFGSPFSFPAQEQPPELFVYVKTAAPSGPAGVAITFTHAEVQCP